MNKQKQKLELEANRIEQVLRSHGITTRVTGGTVTPRWTIFTVIPLIGVRISHIRNLTEELAVALAAPNCRISRRGAAVAIEVPRDDPQPVRLLSLRNQLPDKIPATTAILGLAEDGTPLLIRLPSPDVAHVLVAGTTGSGKTVLLQSIILSLAMTNPDFHRTDWNNPSLTLVLIDPKGNAFSPFAGLPHLARPVIHEPAEAAEALVSLLRLMDNHHAARHGKTLKVVVVIDELADLLMTGGDPVRHALTRLTQRGRGAGIHVIAATQKPTAQVLGSLTTANFPTRIVGKVVNAAEAHTASGWSGTGAERLTGRGDFLTVAEGQVTRFQAAYVTAEEIRQTVANLPGFEGMLSPPKPGTPPEAPRVAGGSVTANPPPPPHPLTQILTQLLPPTPPPPPEPTRQLAQELIASHLWAGRHHSTRPREYRWGWMSEVCRHLLQHELEGTWDRQTRQIITMAEAISSTTTRADTPKTGPHGGKIIRKE